MSVNPGWIATALTTVLAGGGFWGWMRERQKTRASAPADLATAYAGFAAAVNAQAEAFIKTLQGEISTLRERVEALEHENETCRSENRNLQQAVGSLERRLIAAGIPLKPDELPNSIIEFDGGQALVIKKGGQQ